MIEQNTKNLTKNIGGGGGDSCHNESSFHCRYKMFFFILNSGLKQEYYANLNKICT